MASFQSFTGTSRRPRQVNLSGTPSNPFASSASSAVAAAQQDRQNRQRERDRLQATARIQRVWRGHSSRRRTFAMWRETWDAVEQHHTPKDGAYDSPEDSFKQLSRLKLFFDPQIDSQRLTWYGMRHMATNDITPCQGPPWPRAYSTIIQASTAVLRARTKPDNEADRMLLTILGFAVRRTELTKVEAVKYYQTLTNLADAPADALQNALVAPLQSSSHGYTGLTVLLAKPLSQDMIDLLRSAIDAKALASAMNHLPNNISASTPSRLWLLGNVICLAGSSNRLALIDILGRLLGSLADDVDFESSPVSLDNPTFDRQILRGAVSGIPLNDYLYSNISSLVDQDMIRNLLLRDGAAGTNAQSLAGYALTLLRCFPRHADDIRRWLYLGPTNSSGTPATQYFWAASKSSSVFNSISQNSRNVLSLIKTSQPSSQLKDDWTLILVFLEVYTFLLKIMDDEEFMGSDLPGQRKNAIPIGDVADLVTFLKNLGFTLYFNSSELNQDGDVTPRDAGSESLSRHFGRNIAVESTTRVAEMKPSTLVGLSGLTIDYLKGLVTGLLRAIYERDSRRHFLPEDHWLMTSRFDMTSFISGVVLEEENRHMVQQQDDEDQDEESEDDFLPAEPLRRGGPASALRSQAARARAQRKASRKRYLESVAPRLEILQNMPFFIPFTTRVEIFREFVHLDQEKRRNGFVDPDQWRQSILMQPTNGMAPRDLLARHHAKIRRKNEFSDAFEQFYELGAGLKEPIQITFVDEFDIPEAGIDGGGVTKEFLTSVISQAFDPTDPHIEQAYFVENDKHLLYPSPTAIEDLKVRWKEMGFATNQRETRSAVKNLMQQYEFLGRIIGKCLYEGILVDVAFAGFFLKKWALTGGSNSARMETGYRPNINDLRELDESLYKGLLAVKNAPPEDVESFGLTFTVDDLVGPEGRKEVIERDLIPNGANTPVTGTAESRLHYISLMSRYRLQGQSQAQTKAFLSGLSSIIQPSWLSMFNQSELQTLISGTQAEIDIPDLRRNTLYGGVYVIGDDGQEHPSIKLFWDVMAKLPDEDRRKVLKFVTSTPRGPLLGFNQLNPRFSIRDSGSDENRYPTTSTCVNLLKLPMYKSERMLKEKLLAAINSGAGFDLS